MSAFVVLSRPQQNRHGGRMRSSSLGAGSRCRLGAGVWGFLCVHEKILRPVASQCRANELRGVAWLPSNRP